MRFLALRWVRAAALVASAAAILSTAAEAGELLVIPYACRVVDGAPVLSPSDNHGYRIIGQREERDFTACSPVNPDMCRRWKVYRFDVDCNGQRVPWISLSAAADTHSGHRSWLEGRRLHVEMPPRWGMYPDDPCARGYRPGWRQGPMSRYCSDRRELQPADVVMPDGFAPMLDLDGIFVADGAPAAAGAPAATLQRAELPVPKPHAETKPSPSPAEKAVKSPDAKPASPPPAKSVTPPVPVPVESAKHETAPLPSQTTTVAAAGTPIMPTIINKPGGAPAEPEKTTATSGPEAAPAPAQPKERPVEVALKDTIDVPARPIETSAIVAGHTAQSEDGSLVAKLSHVANPTVLTAGAAITLGLLALFLTARGSEQQVEFPLTHDIATVSFEGRADSRELVHSRAPLPPASGSAPAAEARPPAKWGDAIPHTREEALQVLGMGVAPDVGDAAIKKIVDGLRLSWHPDHAKTPQDKELRELRMKQINAAWDIITGRRAV